MAKAEYDITIVGAGPAGSYLASLLQKNLNVVVLEGKKVLGGKACSGLVSKDIKKFIPVDGLIENEIDRCVLHSASGKSVGLGIKQGTFALDRDRLDDFLGNGVKNLKFGVSVEYVKIVDKAVIKTSRGEFESEVVVGADGNNSVVRKSLDVKPMDSVMGLMTMIEEKDGSGFFEVWFDPDIVKDGFLWRIPRGRRVEYGVLGNGVKFDVMEDFFKMKNKKCLCERRASPIPTGFHKTHFDRTLLVGDAAAQTKPWSFGGILYGMECGQIASQVIKGAFLKRDFSEKTFEEYEKMWRTKLEKSISMGMMFREFYKDLDRKKVDVMFDFVKRAGIKEIDMDHPLINLFG